MNTPTSSMAPSTDPHRTVDDSPPLLTDWALGQLSQSSFQHEAAAAASLVSHLAPYTVPFQSAQMDFQSLAQPMAHSGLPMDSQLVGLDTQVAAVPWAWDYLQQELPDFDNGQAMPSNAYTTLAASPTDSQIEVRSLTSSNSECGWATVDRHGLDPLQDPQAAVFNPSQTLHGRTYSHSSTSDGPGCARNSMGSFEEVWHPQTSPRLDMHERGRFRFSQQNLSPSAAVDAEPIKPSASASPLTSSSQGSGSPPLRRQGRKSPTTKPSKPISRRLSQPVPKDAGKRVGRRRGPLLPEQRKQAGEIRKLRACLRCKFLKKVCDKGEPCAGCQPAHARLWQVPCTRIDIKDVAYFMKDWKADFERHVTLAFSVDNVKGFSNDERSVYITHGYGIALPIMAREVYVRDEHCFDIDWVEANNSNPIEFEVRTARLSAGEGGIPSDLLSEYLDRHIDGGFEIWVDRYFEGTPFLTEMLKTVYRYYLREKLPVIRKALKLVLAYNLTMHVTLIEGLTEEENVAGKITDESSRFQGKTVAPVMINFQIKCALAKMWRDLQKDILEELSALYQSVWNGNKWKNWPTTFLLAAVLLAVWEEMQFDCHYRVRVSLFPFDERCIHLMPTFRTKQRCRNSARRWRRCLSV